MSCVVCNWSDSMGYMWHLVRYRGCGKSKSCMSFWVGYWANWDRHMSHWVRHRECCKRCVSHCMMSCLYCMRWMSNCMRSIWCMSKGVWDWGYWNRCNCMRNRSMSSRVSRVVNCMMRWSMSCQVVRSWSMVGRMIRRGEVVMRVSMCSMVGCNDIRGRTHLTGRGPSTIVASSLLSQHHLLGQGTAIAHSIAVSELSILPL